jgi:hypothetical protein
MKVFGIGLPRCGGQTLQRALAILYGSCLHSPGNRLDLIDDYPASVEVFIHPETLYDRYGDCKLILNTRDIDLWLESCRRVYAKSETWNHPIWKHPREDFWRYYLEYHQAREPFDTLDIDLTLYPSWQPLCDFLGKPIPDEPFPNIDRVRRGAVKDRTATC